MGKGIATVNGMGQAGGKPEIGLETATTARYILTQDAKARYNVLK